MEEERRGLVSHVISLDTREAYGKWRRGMCYRTIIFGMY